MQADPHPIAEVPDVDANVNFVEEKAMRALPKPWPRSQDLDPKCFGKAGKDDVVVAVSHCWPYAGHPDPLGDKVRDLNRLLDQALETLQPKSRLLLFLDFISVSQRPFKSGQRDRTPEQQEAFGKALRAFPFIYLQADAVLHLDTKMKPVPNDNAAYYATMADLDKIGIKKLRESLVVVQVDDPKGNVQLFDILETINGKPVTTEEELEELKKAWRASKPDSKPITSIFKSLRPTKPVKMRRCPFGFYSTLSADKKGWVYLERFASMVKGAMVPEDQLKNVAYATSQETLDEIFQGAQKLRTAARKGREQLKVTLEDFYKELEKKHFFAVSLDKANNTGGVGGVKIDESTSPPVNKAASETKLSQDAIIVGLLMRELVDHLAEKWDQQQFAARQRALLLAVNRGDITAARQLLEEGADPTQPDKQGVACLHCAARGRDLDMVNLLIEFKSSPSQQDMLGNCPAHMVVLFAQPATASVFEVLANTEDVLTLPNSAGVTPYRRFSVWAKTALDGLPYPPAKTLLETLEEQFPDLANAHTSAGAGILIRQRSFHQDSILVKAANGKMAKVSVWTPRSGDADLDLVWVGQPVFLPPELEHAAVSVIASAICGNYKVRILLCDYYTMDASLTTVDGVAKHLQSIIDGLPLKDKVIFVDNSVGYGVHAMWNMHAKGKILGGVVVNPHGWFSEEYFGSDAYNEMVPKIGSVGQKFLDKNKEGCKNMVGNWVFSESAAELEDAKTLFSNAMDRVPDEYWTLSANAVKINLLDATPAYQKLKLLSDKGVRMTLACSSHAPVARVLDTVARLKGVAPEAKVVYIPESKQWWELEGTAKQNFVANLVIDEVKVHSKETPEVIQPSFRKSISRSVTCEDPKRSESSLGRALHVQDVILGLDGVKTTVV